MSITQVGAITQTKGSKSPTTAANLPTLAKGDTVVIWAYQRGDGVNTPALGATVGGNAATVRIHSENMYYGSLAVLTYRAPNAMTTPALIVTGGTSTNQSISGIAICLRGVDATTPIDNNSTPAYQSGPNYGLAPYVLSLHENFGTITDRAWAFAAVGSMDDNTWTLYTGSDWTPDASDSLDNTSGTDDSQWLGWKEFASITSPLGWINIEQTANGPDHTGYVLFSIKPAYAVKKVTETETAQAFTVRRPPNAPTNVDVDHSGNDHVIAWTDETHGLPAGSTKYDIYRSTSPDTGFQKINGDSIASGVQTYTDETVSVASQTEYSGASDTFGTTTDHKNAFSYDWPGGVLRRVRFRLTSSNSPTDAIQVRACADDNGKPGTTIATSDNTQTVAYPWGWYDFEFGDEIAAQKVWFVVERTGSYDNSKTYTNYGTGQGLNWYWSNGSDVWAQLNQAKMAFYLYREPYPTEVFYYKVRAVGYGSYYADSSPSKHDHINVSVVQAAETETAQNITVVTQGTVVQVGQVTETQTAQALQLRKTLVRAIEYDDARDINRQTIIVVEQINEQNWSRDIDATRHVALTQATETQTPQDIKAYRPIAVARATETDASTAVAGSKHRTLDRADETDAAQTVAKYVIGHVNKGMESDSARAIQRVYIIGQATETDAAFGLEPSHRAAVGRVEETDAAQTLTIRATVLAAVESDEALDITHPTAIMAETAAETDTAGDIEAVKVGALAGAEETDTAGNMRNAAVGPAVESDAAEALTWYKTRIVELAAGKDGAWGPSYVAAQWIPASLTDYAGFDGSAAAEKALVSFYSANFKVTRHFTSVKVKLSVAALGSDTDAVGMYLAQDSQHLETPAATSTTQVPVSSLTATPTEYTFTFDDDFAPVSWSAYFVLYRTGSGSQSIRVNGSYRGNADSTTQLKVNNVWTMKDVDSWIQINVAGPSIKPIKYGAVGQSAEVEAASGIYPRDLVARATETDEAFNITLIQNTPVDVATEADTARDITRRGVINRAVEVDTAQTLTGSKQGSLAVSAESDTASTLSPAHAAMVSQATESDTAAGAVPLHRSGVALATETNDAQTIAGTKRRTLEQAADTEESRAIACIKQGTTQTAAEADTARPISKAGMQQIETAVETDTADTITKRTQVQVGIAAETDDATTLTKLTRAQVAVAAEIDEAIAISKAVRITVGRAGETDEASATVGSKHRALTTANEADEARYIELPGAVGRAQEDDAATTVAGRKYGTATATTETETARDITVVKVNRIVVAVAVDTETAVAIELARQTVVNAAVESDVALVIKPVKVIALAQAAETEAANGLSALKAIGVVRALESDIAIALTSRIIVGQATEVDSAMTMLMPPRKAPYVSGPARVGSTRHYIASTTGHFDAMSAGKSHVEPVID